MLELPDKNDINRLEEHIDRLEKDIQFIKDQVHRLTDTNDALKNFIAQLTNGGNK